MKPTVEQIKLLLMLRESKERGSASMGCNSQRVVIAKQLEKLGLVKQHRFGASYFTITEAGLKEIAGRIPLHKPEKKPEPEPVKPKATVAKGDHFLSPISIECGVKSKNRTAALDCLYAAIGKQLPFSVVMKSVYGEEIVSGGALDIVIKSLQRDLGNGKTANKYEIKREKDKKGYTYGLYEK